MLVQVGEKVWVDPMQIRFVFAEERPVETRIVFEGDQFVKSDWPVEKVLEQLDGKVKR